MSKFEEEDERLLLLAVVAGVAGLDGVRYPYPSSKW